MTIDPVIQLQRVYHNKITEIEDILQEENYNKKRLIHEIGVLYGIAMSLMVFHVVVDMQQLTEYIKIKNSLIKE